MFVSFFPSPRQFFWSAAIWSLVAVLAWFFFFKNFGANIGLPNPPDDAPPIIGVSVFWSKPFLWFYMYFVLATLLFAGFWMYRAPHPMFLWSVFGSATIIFATYFQVQISVAINAWFGPFYDMIQDALGKTKPVTLDEFFGSMTTFAGLAFTAVFAAVVTRFLVVHYIFRWRASMNEYYNKHWGTLRHIEGASQRVQDDTMRFARSSEDIGVDLISSVLTLIAFLPVLHSLEPAVKELPFLGAIPYPLVTVSIVWSILGTGIVSLCAAKLPGLNFKNQRVEAALRKELVIGEEDIGRATPETLRELFRDVRSNYFTMYLHQIYFNLGRVSFLQANSIIAYIVLAPTIVGGLITLGAMQRILSAFGEVRDSFNFLVNSWYPIVELISIYKRLRTFESAIHGEAIDPKAEYQAEGSQA